MKRAGIIDLGISIMVLIALLFTSCEKDQSVKENKLLIVEQLLKFVNVNDRIQNMNSRFEIIIVTWDEWGRASKDCGGWGLCNADWFPQFSPVQNPLPPTGSASILERDAATGKYYIDILLAEPPPVIIPLPKLTLVIDADIILHTQQKTGHDLVFKAGNYLYNKSLGNFGGYRFYLD